MAGYGYGAVGGPDQIVGGHYPNIVGNEAIIGQVAAALAQKMAEAREIDPNAVTVEPRVRDERRRLIMGNAPVVVAAGSTTEVEFRPQQLFRTERIIVPSEIAPFFRFSDVRIGNRSQLLTSGSLPGSAFSEVAIDAYVHFDSADIGNTITLVLVNKDDEDHTFESMLLGTAVQ